MKKPPTWGRPSQRPKDGHYSSRRTALIRQRNSRNGTEGAEKPNASGDDVKLVGAWLPAIGIEGDTLRVLDQDAIAAFENEAEPSEGYGPNRASESQPG